MRDPEGAIASVVLVLLFVIMMTVGVIMSNGA